MQVKKITPVIEAYKDATQNYPQNLLSWESFGQAKIVLKIRGEEELRKLQKKAIENKIPTGLVIDEGRTQISSGTVTCCAIGPGIIFFIINFSSDF